MENYDVAVRTEVYENFHTSIQRLARLDDGGRDWEGGSSGTENGIGSTLAKILAIIGILALLGGC